MIPGHQFGHFLYALDAFHREPLNAPSLIFTTIGSRVRRWRKTPAANERWLGTLANAGLRQIRAFPEPAIEG